MMINIGLQSEYILSIFGIPLTNTFFTSILATVLLVVLGIIFYLKRHDRRSIFVSAVKILIFKLLKLTDMVTQDRELSKKIFPLISSFFLFIATANILSLIPGFLGSLFIETADGEFSLLRSPNSDLTTTLALAIFSILAIQFFSLEVLGINKYIGRFFNFTTPVKFILGLFELISESIKILSFSFRLFGNILAGEILLLVIAFLIPYFLPVPFMILELFVGIVQAFIFAILTLAFIKISTVAHI